MLRYIASSIPAHFWLIVIYVVGAGALVLSEGFGGGDQAAAPSSQIESAEQAARDAVEGVADALDDAAESLAASGAAAGDAIGVLNAAGSRDCAEIDGSTHPGVKLDCLLASPIATLPLFAGVGLALTGNIAFIILGFMAQWSEAIRATRLDDRRNDLFSILLAFGALLLFVGIDYFQTTAFLVVVLVGFGDVLLDRIIGQAVARRDFGGLVGPRDE